MAWIGVATLDMLAKRGRGVKIELVTRSNGELKESDFEAFAKQCGKFAKTMCGICHDRFIIVDGKEVFWTGASLKDAGRLVLERMEKIPLSRLRQGFRRRASFVGQVGGQANSYSKLELINGRSAGCVPKSNLKKHLAHGDGDSLSAV